MDKDRLKGGPQLLHFEKGCRGFSVFRTDSKESLKICEFLQFMGKLWYTVA